MPVAAPPAVVLVGAPVPTALADVVRSREVAEEESGSQSTLLTAVLVNRRYLPSESRYQTFDPGFGLSLIHI